MAGSSGLSAAVIFGFDGRTFVVCCRLAKCRQVSTHTAGSITRCPLPCLTYFMNLPLTPHVWLAVCTDRRPRARRPQNPRPTIDAGRRGGGQTAHVSKGRGPTAIRGSWAPPAWQARPSHHIGCRNGRRPARSARERRGERARSATLGGVDVPERARGECHVYTYTRVWARDCSGLRLCRAGTFIIRILYERECMQSARSVPFCDRPIPRPGLEGPENPLRFSVVHYGR